MKNLWFDIKGKFESLGIRERLFIVGAIAAISYILCDLFILQSISKNIKVLHENEKSLKKNISSAVAEKKVFENAIRNDPNIGLKSSFESLRKKLDELNQNLESLSVGLVKADALPLMLHDVLKKNERLQLTSLLTLPSEEIEMKASNDQNKISEITGNGAINQEIKDRNDSRQDSGDSAGALSEEKIIDSVRLYKHGVVLTFTGSFNDVLDYIADLENGHWRFYWDTLSYSVESYPTATIRLKVFTLSSERGVFDGVL